MTRKEMKQYLKTYCLWRGFLVKANNTLRMDIQIIEEYDYFSKLGYDFILEIPELSAPIENS